MSLVPCMNDNSFICGTWMHHSCTCGTYVGHDSLGNATLRVKRDSFVYMRHGMHHSCLRGGHDSQVFVLFTISVWLACLLASSRFALSQPTPTTFFPVAILKAESKELN